MKKIRPVALASFTATMIVTAAFAQTPATDGLKFDDGYPKTYATPIAGRFWVSASGGVDTTKYPNGKIDSTVFGGPHCLDQRPAILRYSSPALLPDPPYTSAGVLYPSDWCSRSWL